MTKDLKNIKSMETAKKRVQRAVAFLEGFGVSSSAGLIEKEATSESERPYMMTWKLCEDSTDEFSGLVFMSLKVRFCVNFKGNLDVFVQDGVVEPPGDQGAEPRPWTRVGSVEPTADAVVRAILTQAQHAGLYDG